MVMSALLELVDNFCNYKNMKATNIYRWVMSATSETFATLWKRCATFANHKKGWPIFSTTRIQEDNFSFYFIQSGNFFNANFCYHLKNWKSTCTSTAQLYCVTLCLSLNGFEIKYTFLKKPKITIFFYKQFILTSETYSHTRGETLQQLYMRKKKRRL